MTLVANLHMPFVGGGFWSPEQLRALWLSLSLHLVPRGLLHSTVWAVQTQALAFLPQPSERPLPNPSFYDNSAATLVTWGWAFLVGRVRSGLLPDIKQNP